MKLETKRERIVLSLIFFVFVLTLSFVLTLMLAIISSYYNNWELTLTFDTYREAIIEIIAMFTFFGLYVFTLILFIRLIRDDLK